MAETNADTFAWIQSSYEDLKSEAEKAVADLKNEASSSYDPNFSTQPWTVGSAAPVTFTSYGTFTRPTYSAESPEQAVISMLGPLSEFTSPLYEVLMDGIMSPELFLDASVQAALFAQTRERDRQTLNDALDASNRIQARRGFPAPTSIFVSAHTEIVKKYQDTEADRNKEITALIADKALTEKMGSIDAYVKLEDIRMRVAFEYSRLYTQVSDYIVRKYEAEVRAELGAFESNFKQTMASLDAASKNAELSMETIKLQHDESKSFLLADLDQLKLTVDTWTTSFTGEMRAAEAAVKFYSDAALGVTSAGNAIDYVDKTAG